MSDFGYNIFGTVKIYGLLHTGYEQMYSIKVLMTNSQLCISSRDIKVSKCFLSSWKKVLFFCLKKHIHYLPVNGIDNDESQECL